jgi:hypothetical protein
MLQLKNLKTLPYPLQLKIQALQSEEDAYAADELVELGEEILSQLVAMGIAAYLKQANQKEVFNDFLISLFLSDGHSYNAGPLFRWAANMIKDAEGFEAEDLHAFFWEKENGSFVLNKKVHHLATLRNAVMHGFFVLPPERNREEAQNMETILKEISDAKLFEQNWGDFHFLDKTHFNGQWNIQDSIQWQHYSNCYAFGTLSERIAHEYAISFRSEENEFAKKESKLNQELQLDVRNFLSNNEKGALACWISPDDKKSDDAYRNLIQIAKELNYHPVFYALHENGANFTSSFLIKEIGKTLQELSGDEKASKDTLKYAKNEGNKFSKKPVVILQNIHIALFSPNHLTNLFNALYDANIPILATSWFYPFLSRFFNKSISLRKTTSTASQDQVKHSLLNYLRFKGPSDEQESEKEEFEKLLNIVLILNETLQNEKRAVARRFADQQCYPIEYVHEAFAVLSPYYNQEKEAFKQDEVDELYGFPKTIEESSQIFLSLGRRDIKLEYQHKVLSVE